jgi:hypothetical protein
LLLARASAIGGRFCAVYTLTHAPVKAGSRRRWMMIEEGARTTIIPHRSGSRSLWVSSARHPFDICR